MIGNRITARRGLPSPATAHATLKRDQSFSITVPTREPPSRPRALPLPLVACAIESNGSLPASWETAPPAADRLRCRPAGSGTGVLTFGENELCVGSCWPSLVAFCGARHSWCVGSLRSPSAHPPDLASHLSSAIRHLSSAIRHLSSAIRHLSSAIRHLSFAICHLPSLLPPSPFRIPPSAFSEACRARA